MPAAEQPFLQLGALHAGCTREMAETRDTVICMFGTGPGNAPTSSTATLWNCLTVLCCFTMR